MSNYKSAEKIRVLHVITRLERGGAPAVLLEVLRRCDKRQFEHHIATGLALEPEKDMIAFARDMGFQVFVIPALIRDIHPFLDIYALLRLYFLILRGRYDIVHCHTSKGGFIGRLAARLANVKCIIYSPHGDIFEGYFGKIKTRFFIWLERFSARFTDKIITLTKSGIEPYIKAGIGQKSQFDYIYNGVDIESLRKRKVDRIQKRQELGIENEYFLIVTAGRLVPVKGQTYLISALAQVITKIPNIRLVFLGDGELRGELSGQVKTLGLEKQVLFLGMRSDVPEIISCGDLFVLPSVNEGFGVVLLEAMVMKCPIVATNVGGVPEVVLDGETGILVPSGDPVQLAEGIVRLLRDRALAAQMAESGYQRLKTCFDIRETVAKTENLYRELLERKLYEEAMCK
ncbi:MAG TPA: glycosyltransferase family 4 protein [Candidatus Wunengus sp. YC65]|uniref:glycosyltransferase family 4 protein n=1 Tax=Candidatus Wunengus sp. YC65 TaxID=3367701 RepID=UPI0040276FC7